MSETASLASKILTFMTEHDLSLEDLAARAGHRISTRTLRRILDDDGYAPHLNTWIAIAKVLGDPTVLEIRRQQRREEVMRKAGRERSSVR